MNRKSLKKAQVKLTGLEKELRAERKKMENALRLGFADRAIVFKEKCTVLEGKIERCKNRLSPKKGKRPRDSKSQAMYL